jgi:hypothetical protein
MDMAETGGSTEEKAQLAAQLRSVGDEALVQLVLDLKEYVIDLHSRLGRLEATQFSWGAEKPKIPLTDFEALAAKVVSAWGPAIDRDSQKDTP